MQITSFIIYLILTGIVCVSGSYPTGSVPFSLSSATSIEDGEEWRKCLPEKLSDRKGAPLHKIIIESTSNPRKRVTVYLLGTSHVSRTSCEDAKLLMEYARPGRSMYFLASI
jgi:hypothetical protein